MVKSTIQANKILKLIEQGDSISSVKEKTSSSKDEWFKYSSKAYYLHLTKVKKERKGVEKKRHVSATPNNQILEIIDLNEILADYALLLPIFSTNGEFLAIKDLINNLPSSEPEIIKIIGKITLHPRLRALQKKGRFEQFEHFKIFSKLLDAALLSYYRTNFISCYLTLLPIIEGVIIRWMGHTNLDPKPEFEDVRKFFKRSAQRQPCPHNVLFHNVYIRACDKILNEHFYKPTTSGDSWANFNRHVASHLLNDEQFGTKDNCIRLFILLDVMTEIFLYEARINDPRFSVRNDQIEDDIKLFGTVILDNTVKTPEQIILGTGFSDLTI
ncbi:MAG: hypothetical protein HYU68_12800 [Bacteroidetes bacterium]|nr:hypothetical protein [Bacteroidota bacterium]